MIIFMEFEVKIGVEVGRIEGVMGWMFY
jgi:hypothetical protein